MYHIKGKGETLAGLFARRKGQAGCCHRHCCDGDGSHMIMPIPVLARSASGKAIQNLLSKAGLLRFARNDGGDFWIASRSLSSGALPGGALY
jgi:hypothetical protein